MLTRLIGLIHKFRNSSHRGGRGVNFDRFLCFMRAKISIFERTDGKREVEKSKKGM